MALEIVVRGMKNSTVHCLGEASCLLSDSMMAVLESAGRRARSPEEALAVSEKIVAASELSV
jgi:hypothetical protein